MTTARLLIFDVDGTLVDSQRAILAAMTCAFEDRGHPVPPREAILRIVGLSLPEAFRTLVPDAPPAEAHALAERYKAAFVAMRAEGRAEAEAPLFPGARDAVLRMAEAGHLLSIATGKARRGLDHTIRLHGFDGVFQATQTADDAPSKPHPGMVLNVLERTGFDPGAAVMIGDTGFDMAMARAAGVRALGVGWGYHDRTQLAAGGAERIIDGFAELDGAIGELLA